MLLKIIITGLFIQFFSLFLFAQQKTDVLMESFSNKEINGINIYDSLNIDFFPYSWQAKPMSVKAKNISKENLKTIINLLRTEFRHYPDGMLKSSIRSIYLLDTISVGGGGAPIFAYKQGLYIPFSKTKAKNIKETATILHREIGLMFFDYYPNIYNEIGWPKNDEIGAPKDGMSQEQLYEIGFLNEKSITSKKEDFAQFWSLYCNTDLQKDLSSKYQEIAIKLEKINDFFTYFSSKHKINPRFLNEISKLESDYNIKLVTTTNPSTIPIPFRQSPYNYVSESLDTCSYVNYAIILDSIFAPNQLYYKCLVNNIFLFKHLKSGAKPIYSFSYYSNIYISLEMPENRDITSVLKERINQELYYIIIQNIDQKVTPKLWKSTNIDTTISYYENGFLSKETINDQFNDWALYSKLLLFYPDSLQKLATQFPIIESKSTIINQLFTDFTNELEIVLTTDIDKQAKTIENKYSVNIHYNFKFPFLSNNNILPASLLLLQNPNKYQLKRELANIDTALNVYPSSVIKHFLKNVYILELMRYGMTLRVPGGTYSYYDKSIYLSNIGNSDLYLQKAFHHELSTLLRERSGHEFPRKQWMDINSEYGVIYNSDNYYNNKLNLSLDSLHTLGYIELYSTSQFNNDVEVMSSWLFTKPVELSNLAKKYNVIKLKLKVLCDYYKLSIPEIQFDKKIAQIVDN